MKLRALVPAVLVALCAPVAPALAARQPTPRYYLALGDSLSVGYQPTPTGAGVETGLGYADDLLALEAGRVTGLKLVDVGCPGDTTTSLLTGHGNEPSARKFHCVRSGGSQLAAAVSFLRGHHAAGEVPLVTIDIGANDVDSCVSAGNLAGIAACVSKGESSIKRNTPRILKALRAAAPRGTHFVAMNLYDPVLSLYLSADSSDKGLAAASVPLVKSINHDIESADASSGFLTADVADAFKTYDQSPTVSYAGQKIPVDVAYVCAWTWACTTPPVGPNIHANDNGYAIMAAVFARTAGRLR